MGPLDGFSPSNGLSMNSSELFSAPNLTPKSNISKYHVDQTPTTTVKQAEPTLNLVLRKVLGSTTTSSSGFDANPGASRFALCAGSTAIVASIDDDLNITQRFFRTQPSPLRSHHLPSYNDSPSASNTPESYSRLASSLRRKTFAARSIGSPQVEPDVSSGRANIRQKTRAISCVSLSLDGRFLAVGEIGYNPRILIFSATAEGTNEPLANLSEHALGVRCIAFSKDSRWLCSVGDLHDGFVHLWCINPKTGSAKLHSSNKCISVVHDITWMGSSIVSVGTRHVKVWRLDLSAPSSPSKSKNRIESIGPVLPPSPGPRTLPGRNCLLGPLLDATFMCVATISDSKAVLGTERGAICVLDDGDRTQRLYQVSLVDFGIRCMAIDYSTTQLWVAGNDMAIRTMAFADLVQPEESLRQSRSSSISMDSAASTQESFPGIVALGCMKNFLIAVDSTRSVRIYNRAGEEIGRRADDAPAYTRAHAGAVLGVDSLPVPNLQHSDFFTWSSDGAVIFWSIEGTSRASTDVPLEPSSFGEGVERNELTVICRSNCGSFFISGDKSGVLRLLEGEQWDKSVPLKAHSGEVNDITVIPYSSHQNLIASCGRDRTVQVFEMQRSDLVLIQTIDQHTSSVNEVCLLDGGSTLLSSSSDRTVIIHTLAFAQGSMAYIPTRIITLRTTPLSMTIASNDPSILLVSTIDRQVFKYEMSTGRQLQGMHLIDNDSNESILLSSIVTLTFNITGNSLSAMIGVSSTDKSIRVHDLETGMTIFKDYGHSEGVSDIAVVKKEHDVGDMSYTLISTGLDGTVMLWDLKYTPASMGQDGIDGSLKETPTIPHAPLRRVISRSALSEYQKTLEMNGIPPLPLTPSRSQSPSRLKKKPSRYSLATISSKAGTVALPTKAYPLLPRRQPLDRSTPPTSPITPTTTTHRPPFSENNRTKSASNIHELDNMAEQLCKSLKAFRKQMSSSSQAPRVETAKELETELNITLRTIAQKGRRKLTASESDVGDLFDAYPDKLESMIEEKVRIGLAKALNDDMEDRAPKRTAEETATKPEEDLGSGNEDGSAQRRAANVDSDVLVIEAAGKG